MNDLIERRDSRLAWIRDRKKEGVEGIFKTTAIALPLPPSLHDALRVPRAQRALVVELCRRSRGASDLAALARAAERAGASAVSICPDETHSGCSYSDILAVAQAISLPIICQDPVLDPLQIVMARAHGAAAVVMHPSLVGGPELRALGHVALEYGLDVVLEIRSARDLELGSALRRGHSDPGIARVVALNGRGATSEYRLYERMLPALPDHVVRMATSTASSVDDMAQLDAIGFDAFSLSSEAVDADGLEAWVAALGN